MTVCHINWEVKDDGKISTITISNRTRDLLYEVIFYQQSKLEPLKLSRLECLPKCDMTGGSQFRVRVQGGRPLRYQGMTATCAPIYCHKFSTLVTSLWSWDVITLLCLHLFSFPHFVSTLLWPSISFAVSFSPHEVFRFLSKLKIYLQHSSCRVCLWSPCDPVQCFSPLHS